MPGGGRQWLDPLAEHLRGAGEEAILMRIIGCPHDLVRADIRRQSSNAALHRLERNPTIALEQPTRPGLRCGVVKALVIEMSVHAVEPWRDPPAARFEKRDAQLWMAINNTA